MFSPLLPLRFIKADSSWRKAADRLAGEEEYEALDKLDRLEVFTEHIRWASGGRGGCLFLSVLGVSHPVGWLEGVHRAHTVSGRGGGKEGLGVL